MNELQQALDAVVRTRKLKASEKRALIEREIAKLVVRPYSVDTSKQMRLLMDLHPKEVINSVVFAEWVAYNKAAIIKEARGE